MISICIPTYNYNVEKLVSDLSQQCSNANVDFEIIVLEDGSDEKFVALNKSIDNIIGANHIVAKENFGRSITRNRLADMAKGEKIIFIDCDSAIPDNLYIKRYLDNIDHDVVCGGTTYNETQYSPEISLRYTFGTKVEKTPAAIRNQAPYSAFTTNNMMISKRIFDKIRFCEALRKYGHEDSLFGFDLQQNSIKIHHIDNPVIHLGIESNEIFFAKTKAGIENLITISHLENISPEFLDSIRVYRTYNKLKKLRIAWISRLNFRIFKHILEKHLTKSKHPKLLLFNIYKLGYLCNKAKAIEKSNKN
jgi:glycosyltransferase involved in cell wall biosynthesis